MSRGFRALQPYVANTLPSETDPTTLLSGLVGDHPSSYSRSPAIWNAAYRALDWNAIYAPLDIAPANLAGVVARCRAEPRLLGFNVTVPYKQAIIPLLDEVDSIGQRLGAVNTVRRTTEGWLIGSNTDGRGAIDSLSQVWPNHESPFLTSLDRMSVLLIGAGGSASSLAFGLAEAIGSAGRLFIANRTAETALNLGRRVHAEYGNAQGMDEADAEVLAPGLDLVVNASTRGQAGPRAAANRRVSYLEPYSALGTANPPEVLHDPRESESERMRAWLSSALPDIHANHATSIQFVLRTPSRAVFFDLIYAPAETMMLRHARWAGHRTLNGQGMIIFQALAAFCDHIARPRIETLGLDPIHTRRVVLEAMAGAW